MYLMAIFFDEINITPGKVTTVLMYMRLINFAIMGVNSQLVNLGKVWGSSFKCAKIIVAKKKVVWEGTETIEGNEDGNFDLQDVKFSYPTKKDVTVLKGTTLDV